MQVEYDAPLLEYLCKNLKMSRNKIKDTLQGRGIHVGGKTVTQFDYPLKRVRNAMKRLAMYGYVKKDFEGGYDEWWERLYCIHGYSLTDKGRATAIWKAYETAEIEYIERSLRNDD